MEDWREKIKGGEQLTPVQRAESVVTYTAWAIVSEGRGTMVKVIAQAINEAEIEAMRLGEIKGASGCGGPWEYRTDAINGELLSGRAAEGWEPLMAFGEGNRWIVLRRRKPFEPAKS